MPCVISNYSNVSSDLGTWMFYCSSDRSSDTESARKISSKFVVSSLTSLSFVISLLGNQCVSSVSLPVVNLRMIISFTAPRSFVFGLTHRVRSGSRDDCACMAPGCRLSRLLPAMRCVAGRRILKLIKRLDSVTSPRGVGATDGLPRTNPDPVPRPRPPTFRAGPGPRRSLVDMSGDPLGTARARARAASVSRFQIEFQKDSSERVLRYTWRALGRIDDVRHGAASGTFPRRRGCI
jgi:hypothetical protein